MQTAKKLAHDAGLLALKIQSKDFHVDTKGSKNNLVSDADKAAEELIITTIKKNFPTHSILSEERAEIKGEADYKWIIDPIDGTTNFVHGLPFFSISIAVIKNGKPVVGVVELPALKETFWAQEGKGAYLNNKKISVSKTGDIRSSLTATGFPYDRTSQRYKKNLELWDHFYSLSHGVRRVGSAAIDMCFVACGRFDAYWEYDIKPWDVAAGKIIIEEAGGTVTNMDGSKLNPNLSNILATNSRIHSDMLSEFKKMGADKI